MMKTVLVSTQSSIQKVLFDEKLQNINTKTFIHGQGDHFYGIDFWNNYLYFSGENARSKLFRYSIKDNIREEVQLKNEIRECHEIKFVDSKLWITDTKNDRILIKDVISKNERSWFPFGKGNDKFHLNSLFFDKEGVYVLKHNHSSHSKKRSEICKFDYDFQLLNIFEGGMCSHDIWEEGGDLFTFDSLSQKIKNISRNKDVANIEGFLRGYCCFNLGNEKIRLVGSTHCDEIRAKRQKNNSRLYFLNKNWEILTFISLPPEIFSIRKF